MPPPPVSDRLRHLASDYGQCFSADELVWDTFLGPSCSEVARHWAPARGSTNSRGDVFDFEFAYVENKDFPNAVCTYGDGLHACLVYHSTPIVLLELFYRLLADTNTFTSIGDINTASRPLSSPKSVPGFAVFSGETKISYFPEICERFAPACPTRRLFANQLYHAAMAHIWSHEFTHAISGHVLCEGPTSETNELTKNADKNRQPTDDQVRALMECQADNGAIGTLITLPLYTMPECLLATRREAVMHDLVVRLIAGALTCWTWMVIENETVRGSHEKWSDYPSSVARMAAIILVPLLWEKMPEGKREIISEATSAATKNLVLLAERWPVFRPFRWLLRNDLHDRIFAPYMLNGEVERKLRTDFAQYRFAHPPEL